MISVHQAKARILKYLYRQSSEHIKLSSANKRVLAYDIISPVSHPLFNQSAVDGYAVRFKDVINAVRYRKTLRIIGESKTGEFGIFDVKQYDAVKIFTGASVPYGCDSVIMQEDVVLKGDNIIIKTKPLFGANIRKKGSQIRKRMTALRKGTVLNSASIGYLASLGINTVKVSSLPNVSIIVTGNEFAKPSGKIKKGSIYESNGLMLKSLLKDLNVTARSSLCKDNLDVLTSLVEKETAYSDIVILSGGVSVGDYDYTEKALRNLKFKIIFHNVFQKPGKPLLFAKKKNKTAFGLPGNPRSVLVCFWEYVYPFIQASMGNNNPFLNSLRMPLLNGYEKDEEKYLFLSSKLTKNGVRILKGQASHMLKSFSEADAIVCLSEGKKKYKTGELVDIRVIPY